MADFPIEQAIFRREHEQPPRLVARSAGFDGDWLVDAERLILGFGERSGGVACPSALFAYPLNDDHVAVVQVADQEAGPDGWPVLGFRFLVSAQKHWNDFLGDPFIVSARLPADWTASGELPTLTWPQAPLPRRTLADVQAVLQRVKAHALREDEDPETVQRTVENSESPALLGGAQVLVDGGELVFVRPKPDNELVQGLWTLLPHSLRPEIFPATFAFSNTLGFDVVVVPRLGDEDWEGYTTEDQAADYPAGSYELALQVAAETNDQAELDRVFARRTSKETLRLAVHILVFVSIVVIAGKLFMPSPPDKTVARTQAAVPAGIVGGAAADPWSPVVVAGKLLMPSELFTPERQAAVSAGIVGAAAADPWSSLTLYQAGKRLGDIDKERGP